MDDNSESLKLLQKCDPKTCLSLLHNLVDGICRRSRPTYQDYSKVWSLQEWWAVSDTVTDVLKSVVRETWTKDQVLKELDCLSDEHKQNVMDVVNSRRSEIKQQLLMETHNISQGVLTDFDWKMKLVMSSDKISTVQEPMLSLDLDVQSQTDRRKVAVELDRDELKKLITSFEAANKAMVQLKS